MLTAQSRLVGKQAKVCSTLTGGRLVYVPQRSSSHVKKSSSRQTGAGAVRRKVSGVVRSGIEGGEAAAATFDLSTSTFDLSASTSSIEVDVGAVTPAGDRNAGDLSVSSLMEIAVKTPLAMYCHALETNPLATKAFTSFVGFMLGDLIAQHLSHPAFIDPTRVLRLGTYGFFIDGPSGGAWYEVLEKQICPDNPNGTPAVLMKTAADQLVWAPLSTVAFFAVIKLLEGHPELIWTTIHDKTIPTLLANYVLWPVAHMINFKFVPHNFRILYNNVVCVAWLTWLSLLTHKAAPAAHHTVSILLKRH